MREAAWVWITGGVVSAATVASLVLNAIFVFNLPDQQRLTTLRALSSIAFGLQIVAIGTLSYYCTFYTRRLSYEEAGSQRATWVQFGVGVVVAITAMVVTGASLGLSVTKEKESPYQIFGQSPMMFLAAWFTMWALGFLLHILLFVILGFWTKNVFKTKEVRRRTTDFGIQQPPMEIAPGSRRSFSSRDTTLYSRPTSRAPSSFRTSISTRLGTAYSSRTKLIRNSSRSSLDVFQPFPVGEVASSETAFDNWDTSTLPNEMRSAVLATSPSATRSGLEPIPGSRPESPEDAIIPTSPALVSSESLGHTYQDIPSSPPNFSRPTSKSQNKSFGGGLETSQSLEEMIHPLFRQSSPDPHPTPTSGTMVTASPLANRPMTPKTLSRLRSRPDLRKSYQAGSVSGQWRTMPSIDTTPRPRSKSHSFNAQHERGLSSAGSIESVRTTVTAAAKSEMGSPGPSVYEDDELPPILPGFVLGAGQRSSMIDYGKRKSVKKTKKDSNESQSSWRYSRGSFMGSDKPHQSARNSYIRY